MTDFNISEDLLWEIIDKMSIELIKSNECNDIIVTIMERIDP
jgi:hypothetical protein